MSREEREELKSKLGKMIQIEEEEHHFVFFTA
jgi:hypothetical protein